MNGRLHQTDPPFDLEALGYDAGLDAERTARGLQGFDVGRLSLAHRELYRVLTAEGELEAEITGNLRYSARDQSDLPAVGDWVAISSADHDLSIIHAVLPRRTVLSRAAPGRSGETQIIAANVDLGFIVQSLDRDFSINRMERYLTMCHGGGVTPLIVLSKTDLVREDELCRYRRDTESRLPDVRILTVSNRTGVGYEAFRELMEPGVTGCFLGSSGVGKSTLLNNLCNGDQMKTGEISHKTGRGTHTTSHRELFALEGGGVLIDNPGMREVGVADAAQGLNATFNDIVDLARACRFADCTHTREKGCAVLEAVENGEIDEATLTNFLKLEREKRHFESTVAEKRKRDKAFGKMVKSVMKSRKKERF